MKKLIPLLVIFMFGCGPIDLKPRQVQAWDFKYVFPTKDHPSKKKVRDYTDKVADQFIPWLGEDAQSKLVSGKIKVEFVTEQPERPFTTQKVNGWTYPLAETRLWDKYMFVDGGHSFEIEHHFICSIWKKQGKIDQCTSRSYNEGESIRWRKENLERFQ